MTKQLRDIPLFYHQNKFSFRMSSGPDLHCATSYNNLCFPSKRFSVSFNLLTSLLLFRVGSVLSYLCLSDIICHVSFILMIIPLKNKHFYEKEIIFLPNHRNDQNILLNQYKNKKYFLFRKKMDWKNPFLFLKPLLHAVLYFF